MKKHSSVTIKHCKIKSDDERIWYNRAIALHHLGFYKKAKDSYNTRYKLSPIFIKPGLVAVLHLEN
jgi:hypothetical protein